jgi:hypothetical protein
MRLDTRQTIDIISAIAVVASLLFVGFQLMLDRRIAEAAQHHGRTELQFELHRTWLEDEDLIELNARQWETQRPSWWSNALEAQIENGISMETVAKQRRWALMVLFTHNNNFHQYQLGLLDESGWESALTVIRRFMSNPSTASTWLGADAISPEFRLLLQQVQEELR